MLFTTHPIVATTNTEDNKKVERLPIQKGIITWISVTFPKGCHGLVFCQIFHHETQIAPSIEGEYLTGDGYPIEWSEYYECYQPPFELKIKAWSVACSYDHVVTVRVAILPRKAIVAVAIVDAIIKLFEKLNPIQQIFRKGQGE